MFVIAANWRILLSASSSSWQDRLFMEFWLDKV